MPPIGQPYIEANKELADLARATGANFIGVKSLSDPFTKRVQPRVMQDDLHYNYEGIREFARQIKRSVYSNANYGLSSVLPTPPASSR